MGWGSANLQVNVKAQARKTSPGIATLSPPTRPNIKYAQLWEYLLRGGEYCPFEGDHICYSQYLIVNIAVPFVVLEYCSIYSLMSMTCMGGIDYSSYLLPCFFAGGSCIRLNPKP